MIQYRETGDEPIGATQCSHFVRSTTVLTRIPLSRTHTSAEAADPPMLL